MDSGLSDNEQDYLDTLKESFEDGDITPRERKMLERIRVSLGISEERAKEIESLLIGNPITEDEREYVEMYKEYLEDGEISEKERRRLNKFAMALGISQDRINELEKLSK